MPEYKKPMIINGPSGPLEPALKVFSGGGVIAYPTETFYGLGVDPFNETALERLFSIKGRPGEKPVPLIVKDMGMLLRVAASIPPLAERLIKKFWPGPLTIIFEAKAAVPALVTGGTGKIGVRISSGEICAGLLTALNSPITATSANPSGKTAALTAQDVLNYFNGHVDLLIDGGTLRGRLGSTIVDVTAGVPEIVRQGDIASVKIFDALKDRR